MEKDFYCLFFLAEKPVSGEKSKTRSRAIHDDEKARELFFCGANVPLLTFDALYLTTSQRVILLLLGSASPYHVGSRRMSNLCRHISGRFSFGTDAPTSSRPRLGSKRRRRHAYHEAHRIEARKALFAEGVALLIEQLDRAVSL